MQYQQKSVPTIFRGFPSIAAHAVQSDRCYLDNSKDFFAGGVSDHLSES